MTTVIDASFAVHVQVTANGDDAAETGADLAIEGLITASNFWLEVASALRKLKLRDDVDEGGRLQALKGVRGLRIALEPTTPDIEPIVAVSDRYQLTIYDAAYLELALRTGSRLATRDGGLTGAAARAGVPVVTGG